MEQFLWIILIFSLILLFMAIGYVINNLIYTVKLLLKTFKRLEQTVTKVEEVATLGEEVYKRYASPIASIVLGVNKVTSLIGKIKHKLDKEANYEN